jgi:hypothetical protein
MTKRKRFDWANVFKVDCIIYLYECTDTDSEHFGKKYVGQTRVSIKVRHNEHLCGRCKLDKALKSNPTGFTLSIIEQQSFESMVATLTDKAKLLAVAQDWMNKREVHWIAKHGSYSNTKGFNRDGGGQKGRNQKFFEARLLDQEREWVFRWRALRAYKAAHGDLLVQSRFRFPDTYPDATLRGYRLGNAVHHLRLGNNAVSAAEKQRLEAEGFVWDVPVWEHARRWRALRAYKAAHGDLLAQRRFRFPDTHPDATLRGYRLGKAVNNLRSRHIAVSAAEKQLLEAEGFEWRVR